MKVFSAFFLSLIMTLINPASTQEMSAVDDFTSILNVGVHQGFNNHGSCQVIVDINTIQTNRALKITVIDKINSNSKDVIDGSDYRIHLPRYEFIQSFRTYTGHDKVNYNESIIRTIIADNDLQYVVVSNATVRNTETTSESTSECIVNR